MLKYHAKGEDFMDKYYHFTSFNNLDGIMNNGLIPQSGFRTYSIDDSNSGVFLSKGIDNSIKMYAFMFGYYNKVIGYKGTKEINDCMSEIDALSKSYKNGFTELRIKNLYSVIDRINSIRSCSNFLQYIGGYPCLLSICGIDVKDSVVLENCCYDDVISPSNISLVNLWDKYNNVYYTYFDAIVAYLKNKYPLNSFSQDHREDISNLYNYINSFGFINFNPCYCDLIDVPILNYKNQKVRALNN